MIQLLYKHMQQEIKHYRLRERKKKTKQRVAHKIFMSAWLFLKFNKFNLADVLWKM